MAIEKIQILAAVLELPARQLCQSIPFTTEIKAWRSGEGIRSVLYLFSTATAVVGSVAAAEEYEI